MNNDIIEFLEIINAKIIDAAKDLKDDPIASAWTLSKVHENVKIEIEKLKSNEES